MRLDDSRATKSHARFPEPAEFLRTVAGAGSAAAFFGPPCYAAWSLRRIEKPLS